MTNQPKVSVIIPVYGVEKYLRQCLNSVINQTLKDIEIIVIDDGGKDKCPQIIDEYAAKDNRIKAIHKTNGGYGQTCNRGLEIATGEYIAILEPDDYIEVEMYEDLYNLAIKNNADVVKSSFYKKMDNEKNENAYKMRWSQKYEIPTKAFTIMECPYFLYFHPSIWSCIYKNNYLKANNIKFVEAPGAGWTDNPFQVQTMCLAERIVYTDKAYYYWRCVNLKDSDDLKDYTLPFKRSDEIHEWLEKNNITDSNLMEALYARELAYIHIVFNKEDGISNKEDCYARIKALCLRMNPEIIKHSSIITNRNKRMYKRCCKNPKLGKFFVHIRNYRKKVVSFRWNKDEKVVKILGKTIISGDK